MKAASSMAHRFQSLRRHTRLLNWAAGLLVLASAPFYLFPNLKYWPGLLLLPIASLLAWTAARRPLAETPLNGVILTLAITVVLSTLVTYDLAASLPKIAGIVYGIAIFFLVVQAGSTPRRWLAAYTLFLYAGLAVALASWAGIRWSPALAQKIPLIEPLTRLFPTLLTGLPGAADGFHPNEVAGTLLWLMLPAISLTLAALVKKPSQWGEIRSLFPRRLARAAWVASLAACALVMLLVFALTQSRSGYLGFAAASVLWAVGLLPGRARLAAAAVLAGTGIALLVIAAPFFSALASSNQLQYLDLVNPTLSFDSMLARIGYWKYGIALLADYPITGIGLNTFRYVVFHMFPIPCQAAACDIGHVHNELIQAALDLGLPGLVAFLGLYAGSFWMLAGLQAPAARERARGLPLAWITLGLFGGLFAHFVYGIFDAVTLGAKPGILFWMLIGLICALYRLFGADGEARAGSRYPV